MDQKMKENYSRPLFLAIVGVLILFVTVISISFAMFNYTKNDTIVNTIHTGMLMMTYTEGNTGISITDALPMSDDAGKMLSASNETFKFTVSSKIRGNAQINYEIAAIKKDGSNIDDGDIRLYLEKSTDGLTYSEVFAPAAFTPSSSVSALGAPTGSMVLYSGTFTKTITNHYILRMWLNEDYKIPAGDNKYVVTVNVYGALKDDM